MFITLLVLILFLPFHAFLVTYANHLFNWEVNSPARYLLSSWKEFLIIILAAVFLVKSWKNKKPPFSVFWFDRLIILLFIYAASSILWTSSSLREIIYGLRTDFQFFLVYFIARNLDNKEEKREILIKWILIIGLLIAIFALAQIYLLPPDFLVRFGYSNLTFWDPAAPLPAFQKIPGSDLVRAQATFGGPHQLASFLLIVALISFERITRLRKGLNFQLISWTVSTVVILLAIYYTYARSTWIALIFGLYLLLISKISDKLRKRIDKIALAILVAGIVFTAAIFYQVTPQKIFKNPNSFLAQTVHRPSKIGAVIFHQISTSRRIGLLGNDLRTIVAHPWGQGPGSTGIIEFRMSGDQSNLNESWFLEMALAYGLIGLALYLAILYGLWHKIRFDPLFSSIFIAMVIYSLFISSMSEVATAVIFWTLVGLSIGNPEKKGEADILGIKIDRVSFNQALGIIENFIKEKKSHQIVTVNPEFIVGAQKDIEFKKILNQADLSVADGIGLVWIDPSLPERITGVDLTWALAKLATEKNYSMYSFGAKSGIAQKAAEILKSKYPKLKIWADSGPNSNKQQATSNKEERLSIENIQSKKPDILLVAFGTPKQEKWIAKHLYELRVPAVMGVGGTFDFIAGVQKRAPKWMRKIGLEWFYRLLRQPRRLRRIINAIIVFPWLYIFRSE